MRYFLLILLALPTYAAAPTFSQEELMGERNIAPPVCVEGKCTLDEGDLQFIFQRGRLMEEVANRLFRKVQSCNGGRDV